MKVQNKIHPDAVIVDDPFFAAYVNYLGHDVMKCAAGSSQSSWTFLVPEFDFEIMREEFESADTSLFLKPYVEAFKRVINFQNLARQSAGEYLTSEWRDIIQGRSDRRGC